jgi:hypothetical protein
MPGPSQNVIAMAFLTPFFLALSLLFQAAAGPPDMSNILNPAEQAQMSAAQKVEDRIKVYLNASIRIQRSLHETVTKKEYETTPNTLQLWGSLLSKSLEDIEANLKTKKKSKALIRYEIQVRKALVDLRNSKVNAPYEQQDAFDDCITRAESIRKKFVEILFPR